MPVDLSELLTVAADLALSAGEIVRRGASASDFTVSTKSSLTDPVTQVDKASEAHIVEALGRLRPDDGILGEEGASLPSRSGTVWIIDPIDGTTNFIYGIPAYAVSIGVSVDGSPAVGAVYNVAADELFTAQSGTGAFLNGKQITTNDTEDLSVALVATGFSYSASNRVAEAHKLTKLLGDIRDLRRVGSASLDLCNVACGRVDAYYEGVVQPWDVTAGAVILAEAGGVVSSLDGKIATHDVIAACNQAIYDQLLPYVC